MQVNNKIVLITGASKGIGAACAEQFAKLGARLILCARSADRLNALAEKLTEKHSAQVLPVVLDVSQHQAVQQALASLPAEWQAIDILVNNAGFALGADKIQDASVQDWDKVIDTNVKGLLYVTRYVINGMLERNQGHIINIGSVSGYQVYPGGTVYCASKFAVRAISEGIKMDVHGTPIRVSAVNPGLTHTEFSATRFDGDRARADAVYDGMTPLVANDIADIVVFCATRPPHVDVRELTVMPTDQTSSALCHRE